MYGKNKSDKIFQRYCTHSAENLLLTTYILRSLMWFFILIVKVFFCFDQMHAYGVVNVECAIWFRRWISKCTQVKSSCGFARCGLRYAAWYYPAIIGGFRLYSEVFGGFRLISTMQHQTSRALKYSNWWKKNLYGIEFYSI